MRDAGGRRFPGTTIPARAGIGLRSRHHEQLLIERPAVGWLEVHTENYFQDGGPHVRALERARESYPLSLHGVGLGLGSVAPLDRTHLAHLKRAVERFEPALVSEHACWGHTGSEHFNDLLPLPYSEEAAEHLAARVREVQDFLGRQILVENLSSYFAYAASCLTEWEFLAAVVERSGCGLLLDVNNLYVNSVNVGSDPLATIERIPVTAVGEIHLAGHLRKEIDGHTLLVDDHGSQVSEVVWALYAHALERCGPVPTLVEWDTDIPPLETLLAEAGRADSMLQVCHARAA
jgi:uncharacterized protein (UPF0276 family)